jgi:hypothetical protein
MNAGKHRHRGRRDHAGLVVREFDALRIAALIAAESASLPKARIAIDSFQPSRSGDRETSMWMVMTGHALRTRAARGVPAHTIHIANARASAPV